MFKRVLSKLLSGDFNFLSDFSTRRETYLLMEILTNRLTPPPPLCFCVEKSFSSGVVDVTDYADVLKWLGGC